MDQIEPWFRRGPPSGLRWRDIERSKPRYWNRCRGRMWERMRRVSARATVIGWDVYFSYDDLTVGFGRSIDRNAITRFIDSDPFTGDFQSTPFYVMNSFNFPRGNCNPALTNGTLTFGVPVVRYRSALPDNRNDCLFSGAGIWFFILPIQQSKQLENSVIDQFGWATRYTPPVDGIIQPDRLERFIRVREAVQANCRFFQNIMDNVIRLETLDSDSFVVVSITVMPGAWFDRGAIMNSTNPSQFENEEIPCPDS